jgi:hypothetical protein
VPKAIYISPIKNLRAAAEVAKELSSLSGEALREQQARLNQLLSEASKQQEAFKKANPVAGASQYIASVRGASARSRGQASSPHPSAQRARSVTSGHRDKQIQVYDPAIVGKKVLAQGNAGQGDRNVGNKSADQNPPDGQGACSAGGGRNNNISRHQQQGAGYVVQHQGGGQPRHREDDGNSALARTGYQQPQQQQYQQYEQYQQDQPAQQQNMIPGPIASQLGPRSLAPDDARFKLDRIYQTELVERQGASGPMCFGPRIMGKTAPYCFQLAHGARTYNGSMKPEDWLEDYSTAVNIARGNLRWAVRYVPQMLEGPARIWLNNLPAGSINCWVDFEEQFVSNFTSTYKRPNCPQQLANCR